MPPPKRPVSKTKTYVEPGTRAVSRAKAESVTPPQPINPAIALLDLSRTKATPWLYLLVVLLLPVLVLWRQDNTLFTGASSIDPWVYFGFFQNFKNFNHDIFPATYYGSRLSWILPGYLVHSIFSPVVASAVLHLIVQSAATVSLFTVLRTFTGPRAAFLTTLLFSVNPWLWAATGWDYVDGAGIAYWLLTIAFLTRAVISSRGHWMVLVAGIFAAATVYSNLFWILLVPILPVYYVTLMWASGRALWRAIAGICICAGAGAAILTGVLAAISYRVTGDYWFYAPSIQFARRLAEKNPWFEPIWGANGLAPWLWFPLIGLATAVLGIPLYLRDSSGRTRVPTFLLSFQLAFGAALFGYLQYAHRVASLGLFYYASYLLPSVFLVLGIAFWQSSDKLSRSAYISLCCVAALAFAAVWSDSVGRILPAWPVLNIAKIVVGSSALLAALVLRRRIAANVLAMAGLFVFTSSVRVPLDPDPHLNRHAVERITRLRNRIETVRRNGPVYFWFNERDPDALDYLALNSTYLGGFTWLPNFPAGGCQDMAYPYMTIVVESRLPSSTEIAKASLATCWKKFALKPSVVSVETAVRSGQPYTLSLFKAQREFSVIHPLRVTINSGGKAQLDLTQNTASAEPAPIGGWYLLSDAGSMRGLSAERLEARTPPQRKAMALAYSPLVAPISARYRFTLRYAPISGSFTFGVSTLDGGRADWSTVDTSGSYQVENSRELAVWMNFRNGQEFQLWIANNNDFTDRAASFIIDQVTAAFIPSASP